MGNQAEKMFPSNSSEETINKIFATGELFSKGGYFSKEEYNIPMSYLAVVNPGYKVLDRPIHEPATSFRRRNLPGTKDIIATMFDRWNKPESAKDLGKRQESFTQKLILSFEREVLEDGLLHPAEFIIEDVLKVYKHSAPEWINDLYTQYISINSTISANILLTISRLKVDMVVPWGYKIVDQALKEQDIEIREAAVRAVESWGGEKGLQLLKSYVDSEPIKWLADYTKKIIKELSE